MVVRRMKSREVRDNWRDALDFVRAGGEIVVLHYNRPVARIVPIKEPAMTTYVVEVGGQMEAQQ